MSRLTQRTENGASLILDNPKNDYEAQQQVTEKFKLALNKLADYEDKEENIEKYGENTINYLADKIHKNAIEHGWWEEKRTFGEIIALCHSELSEALEEYRAGNPMEWYCFEDENNRYNTSDMDKWSGEKTEGMAVEMVDCIIRILDYLAAEGIDIDAVMRRKMEYNATRSYKHGGKRI